MINLYLGDSLEAMKNMPDNAYELAIVDPPYGIGAGSTSFMSGARKKSTFHKKNDWDLSIPEEKYFEELKRVSVNQIVWGANYMTRMLDGSKGWVFWDKKTGDTSYGDGELAYTSFNKALKKIEIFWSGAHAKEKNQLDRIHPTQKPVKLYEWLLMNYAKEGDKILDTHLGSGSIAIACHNLGFSLDAWEIDEDYYKATMKRFKNHTAQLRIL